MLNKFDELIKQAITEDEQNVTLPPVDDVWNNIKNRIERQKPKRKRTIRKKIIAAAALLIVISGSYVLVVPDKATAVGKKIMKLFISSDQDTLTINTEINNDTIKQGVLEDQVITKSQAKKILSPAFKFPDTLPGDYNLKEIKILVKSEHFTEISLLYTQGRQELIIRETSIGDSAAINENYSKDNKIEYVEVNKHQGILISLETGTLILKFKDDYISYVLRGEIEEDLLIEIAKALS